MAALVALVAIIGAAAAVGPSDKGERSGAEPLRFMAVAGYYEGSQRDDAEIVDLESVGTTCTKPPDYPMILDRAPGAFIDGKVRICGGYSSSRFFPVADCYEYSIGDPIWTKSDFSLSGTRHDHEGFILANGSWLLVGGYDNGYTTEIYHDGVMSRGPDLPYDFDNTVGTFINSSHIFLAGVSDKYEEAYLVDVDSWEFTRMPDMSWGRIYYACGMVENKDGERELVVAGGRFADDAVEIFNFGRWEWREGPDLPQRMDDTASIQLEHTFLVAGGNGDSLYLDTIYEFDNVDYGPWIEREQKLQTGRNNFAAIPLPNEWDACS